MLRSLMYRYGLTLLSSVLLSSISAGVTVALLTQINELVTGIPSAGGRLLLVGASLLGTLLVVSMASQLLLAKFGGNLITHMRAELARHLMDIEYEKVMGDKQLAIAPLIEDMTRIVPLVLLGPQLVYNALLVVLCFGYLVSIAAKLFLVLSACLTLTITVYFIFARFVRSRFDAARKAEEAVFDCFRSISEGKKELSLADGRKRHFTEVVLRPALQGAQQATVRAQVLGGVYNAWALTVLFGAIFTVAYLGYARFSLPSNTVAHFVIAALFLISPITFLTQCAQQSAAGMASLRNLERIGLDLESEFEASARRRIPPAPAMEAWQHIRADGVRYCYPAEEESGYELGPINLDIHRGEVVFLTGGNGSGKSTLLLLLCGLLRPSAGCLLIDDRAVNENLGLYRSLFGGVFGDSFLFSHVLDATGQFLPDSKIQEYLQWLGLGNKVRSSQGKLSRLSLSTGQRKRLALLQCYAQDREICFFDEWAADQDTQFREHFYCVLLPQLKELGKTLLVISHDDRYFHVADRIIKLEGGRIIDDIRRSSGTKKLIGAPPWELA